MKGEHKLAKQSKVTTKKGLGARPTNLSAIIPWYFYMKEVGLSDEEILKKYEGTQSLTGSGTSIFDPVLCELIYRWFCPPGGKVLDPFAGGSVRGIVAAKLGYRYIGIELRPEQIEVNRVQANTILQAENGAIVKVKISAKSARLRFHPCEPKYMRSVCKCACERRSKGGILVTIHPTEKDCIEALGGVVIDGLLQPDPVTGQCPFQYNGGLCRLHGTPDKPFGCVASPFTLNKQGTLIVRHRYIMLKCYKDGPEALPAYQTHRTSLDLIFGLEEAQRICDHLDVGGDDLEAKMPCESYKILVENDRIKRGNFTLPSCQECKPCWIVGNGQNADILAPGKYDLIFSCPPYYDLEVYSDLDGELSAMGTYNEFLVAYRDIIAKSVGMLKEDRFACFVVGDIRDKKGFYRGFVSDTIGAFQEVGMRLYNEAILVTQAGSLPIRVGKQFSVTRKLGKTHQNVLIFVKGDPRKATKACGKIEISVGENDG